MKNPYATHGIDERRKGQRYDGHLIPGFTFLRGTELVHHDTKSVVGTAVSLGCDRYFGPGYGGDVEKEYEDLLVTLADGTLVPAYRRTGGNHVVCQDYNFKAVRP